ncbi:MAG: PadR family transcriptional regulator [Nitrososphaerota archaeon]|nr:PadR family transcriptional regulator [Nitrososphaerota archaeon]MDG7022893.1 PadR family transcriptional regulator [Nitrososphaerota archaeon]
MFNSDWAKRSHKGLRRWVLYIVRDSPKSGAEIMDVMEANLQGWWRPSPGSIYPLLKNMVAEGVLQRSQDDKYTLTPAGREEVDHPWPWADRHGPAPTSVEGAIEVISSYTSFLEDLSRSKDPKLDENTKHIRELAGRLAKIGGS